MQIRPLTLADFPAVLRIQAACYTAIAPESAASLQAKWRASPATCFAACVDAQVVGYLLAVPVRWPHLPALAAETFERAPDADVLYLHDLALAPQARGSGAAAALVQALLRTARAQGWRRAGLVAIQDSGAFWSRFGFAPVVPVPPAAVDKLASYGAAVLMALQL